MSAADSLHARDFRNPTAYVGPTFISTLVQAVETGFLLSLLLTFWRRNKEGWTMRFIVVFTSTIGLLQTSFAIRDMWDITVSGYGNWDRVFAWSWSITLAPLMSAWTGIPVQAFMMCRLWMIWNKSPPLLVFLSFWVISHAVIIVVTSARQFTTGFLNLDNLSSKNAFSVSNDPSILVCLIVSAALNTIATFLMVIKLVRSWLNFVAPQQQKVVDFISALTWESGLPSSACSLAAAFLYGFMNNYSFWYRPFQSILGKLYIFSLLITLNNRRDLRSNCNEETTVADRGFLSSIRRLDSPVPIMPVSGCPRNLSQLRHSYSSQMMDLKDSGGGGRPSHLSSLNFASLSEINSLEFVPGRKSTATEDHESISVCGCQRSDCSYIMSGQSCHSSQTQVGSAGNVVVEVITPGDS